MDRFELTDVMMFLILCYAFWWPVEFSEWLTVIAGPFISP